MATIVTGGAGFIGSTLVDRLLADGRDVVAVDNFDPYYAPARKRAHLSSALKSPRLRLVELDIRDGDGVATLVRDVQPDAIAHLAARAGVRPSIADPAGYAEVNVVGTIHWLEAARRLANPPRFVYASSSSVYGDRVNGPFRESDPVDHPVSPYAATKKACELLAATYHHLYALPITGLRLFTAFGPRNRPDLAIAKFADLITRGQPIPMFGDGSSQRDYTFVGDIVDGITRALDRANGLHLYNLGHESPVALLGMIEALGRTLGRTPEIQVLPPQPGDVGQTHADITLARRELGYNPRTSLAEGLNQYVAWLRATGSGNFGS